MKKTIVMVQTHKNLGYIVKLAEKNREVDFLVHMDRKKYFEINKCHLSLDNLYVLPEEDCVDVYWGDYSQVQATLNLLKKASEKRCYKFYHLLSGECLPLLKFIQIEKEWQSNPIQYIEARARKETNWRIKTRVYHTKKKWMRSFRGKLLNRAYMMLGNFTNSSSFASEEIFYGSQWFSITSEAANYILEKELDGYFKSFEYSSCPDEHAFQMCLKNSYIFKVADENKRYILFSRMKSSPDYLTIDKENFFRDKYWFVRKVNEIEAMKFLSKMGD